MIQVKIKKLVPNAVIPSYAKPGDAGMDLTAIDVVRDDIGNWIYKTGIAVEIPVGFVGLVFPRSSNRKKKVYMPNSVGIIDSGYRGEIEVNYKDRDEDNPNQPYAVGERIAQFMIIPYPTVKFVESEKLSKTERGIGGHGSTGN